ncbi:hypothetical protein [Glycomyces harbinensis]|uniref:Uncharacterized protein n=1 Tax=Glycomyces harbinensis TaxID=58114 RepID=A0A1G6VSU4_9ACTN|nr:hypothetical protein [Glycomyces harbinensis]SDD56619.1 hypothetical protein SAMN05216270_105110 [Glycomyces harbinensis]
MSRPSAPRSHRLNPWRGTARQRVAVVAAAAILLVSGTTVAAALAFSPGDPPDGEAAAAASGGADSASASSDGGAPVPSGDKASASPLAAGECRRPVGPSPEVTVTEVDTGTDVAGYGGEGDTEPLPMAIAARPGGSWLAWLGADDQVHLARLDCDDRIDGDVIDLEGIDLQDVAADGDGVVVLVTREGSCGDGPLCGGESSPCNTMHMVRFDNAGEQQWGRQVTNLGDGLAGYDDGARFVWWYQHHGRLATDGSNWAAYFGVAITVSNGGCVDVHQGDRMQVVDADGNLVDHADAFEVGCSHSWTTRIAWNEDAGEFGMVCATDNECRIARPAYRTVAAGTCDGTLFGGDLVAAGDGGYWTAWSQGGAVRLEHFDGGASDSTVDTGVDAPHPHLVSYGPDLMLLAWESGSGIEARVYDSGGGAVGDAFAIDVPDHDYQAFKAFDDGSAAYAGAGGGSSILIARVMPMSG